MKFVSSAILAYCRTLALLIISGVSGCVAAVGPKSTYQVVKEGTQSARWDANWTGTGCHTGPRGLHKSAGRMDEESQAIGCKSNT